ncbi:MAG: hypothetical protein KIT60_12045 [Burkholderiaceae bacterium]|nr:hypothetical protein [Burkholderiaceae bacterium]
MTPEEFASIGAGIFEFPIAGSFVISSGGGATILETPDESRRYYVGAFSNVSASRSAESGAQVAKLEQVIRASWENFASSERGTVRVPFSRASAGALTVFFMATEFTHSGQVQYYVQYAVTNGPRFSTIFAEGLGPARPVHDELLPLILRVKVTGGA